MTLRRRGPAVVVVAVVALALAVTAGYALRRGGAPKPVASSTAQVVRGTVTVTASAAGTVSMVQTRGLSFATTGVVTELDVKVGDQVTAGQVLARIDATDAQSAVDAAQQQLDIAQTNLTRAQAPTPTPTCPAVAAAALLLQRDPATRSEPQRADRPHLVLFKRWGYEQPGRRPARLRPASGQQRRAGTAPGPATARRYRVDGAARRSGDLGRWCARWTGTPRGYRLHRAGQRVGHRGPGGVLRGGRGAPRGRAAGHDHVGQPDRPVPGEGRPDLARGYHLGAVGAVRRTDRLRHRTH